MRPPPGFDAVLAAWPDIVLALWPFWLLLAATLIVGWFERKS